MKLKHVNNIYRLCILSLFTASIGHGEIPQATLLSARIAVQKFNLILGEPLLLDLTIKNSGDGNISLSYSPDIGTVFISSDGKAFKEWRDLMRPRGYIEPFLLKADQAITTHFVIFYGLEYSTKIGKYAFPEPGNYFIRGGYVHNARDVVCSETIAITVKPPEGENAEVWAKLRDMDGYGRIIQQPTQALDEKALAELAKIVDDHPASLYSHYLALALGKNAHYVRWKSGFSFASKYLELASNMNLESSIREEAMAEWFGLLADFDEVEKAVLVANRLLREFPGSQRKPHLEQWLKRHAKQ